MIQSLNFFLISYSFLVLFLFPLLFGAGVSQSKYTPILTDVVEVGWGLCERDGEDVGVDCLVLAHRRVGSGLYLHRVFQKPMHWEISPMDLKLLG